MSDLDRSKRSLMNVEFQGLSVEKNVRVPRELISNLALLGCRQFSVPHSRITPWQPMILIKTVLLHFALSL